MNDDANREPTPTPPSSEAPPPAEPLIAKPVPLANGRPAGLLNRRRFLIAGAATGVGAASVTLGSTRSQESTPEPAADTPGEAVEAAATAAGAQPEHAMEAPAAPTNQGFTTFVPYEAAIVQAAAARLIPTDDLGPGATEAGVVYFIDRQLQAERNFRGYRGQQYMLGPFLPGENTQGDQSALPLADRFRLGIRGLDAYAQQVYGRGFVALAPEEQDRILADLEAGTPEDFPPVGGVIGGSDETIEAVERAISGATGWFDLLLAYTFAGFFSDPVQGGNRDMVGWKLIGFPGAHTGYPDDILNYGVPFEGEYISLGQYQQQTSGGA